MELLNVLLGKYSVLEFARTLPIIVHMRIRTKRFKLHFNEGRKMGQILS